MSKIIDSSGALVDVAEPWPRLFVDLQAASNINTFLAPPAGTTRYEFEAYGTGMTAVFDKAGSGTWSWICNKWSHSGTDTFIHRAPTSSHYSPFFNDQTLHPGTWSLTGVMQKIGSSWVGMVEGFWNAGHSQWGDMTGNYWNVAGRLFVNNDNLNLHTGYSQESGNGESAVRAVAYK